MFKEARLEEEVHRKPEGPAALLDVAKQHREAGRFDQAEATYGNILALSPRHAGALLGLGITARLRGDRKAAAEHFEKAVESAPAEPWAWLELAREHRDAGCLEAAERVYQEALRRFPGEVNALLGMGACARQRGDRAAALAHFEAAAAAAPEHPWPLLELAQEYRDAGRIDLAEASYRSLLKRSPGHVAALIGLGSCAQRQGDRAAAIAWFRAALTADPNHVWAAQELAREYREAGQAAAAEAAYRHLLERSPLHFGALLGLGALARERGDRAAALAHYEAAAAAEPGNPWGWLEQAREHRDAGRPEAAEAAYRAALERAPRNAGALLGLGTLARQRGDRAAALAHFQAAAEAEPNNPWAPMELAAELANHGRTNEARSLLQDLLARDPSQLATWLHLGRLALETGDAVAAAEAFRGAATHHPAAAAPLLELAGIAWAGGRPEEAAELARQAAERAPADPAPLLVLARQAADAERHAEAEALFGQVLALQPANPGGVSGLALTLMRLGRKAEALALLDAAEQGAAPHPALAATRAVVHRLTGDWMAGREAMARLSAPILADGWVRAERFRAGLRLGGCDAAAALLASWPGTGTAAAALEHARGQVADERWQTEAARRHFESALALAPSVGEALHDAVRAALRDLDLPAARAHQLRLAARGAAARLRGGHSANPSQGLLGQIIEDFALDRQALAGLREARQQAPEARLPALMELVRRYPDSTAAAVQMLVALRLAGRFAARPDTRGQGIPPRLCQYWNDPQPPPDALDLMASWQRCNPGFAFHRFDDAEALEFLRRAAAPEVARAFAAAREPAMRSDLFRLAWVYAEGGYYADADDRCHAALGSLVPPAAGLFLHLEEYGTLGNNIIGASAGHPVIGRALSLAAQAILRGDRDLIWLATGPGLLTRAFAQIVAETGALPEGAVILDRVEMHRVAAMHCVLGYKAGARHWTNAAFQAARTAKPGGRRPASAVEPMAPLARHPTGFRPPA
ncbi:tetratricopeptide repeat protein [Siccirubricoccus sp. G192]|uniref:tetratricopeptide repeat protein n=1 Tax=Siccirubricoccus sp. G192 TaxID=2849651 RepID=UPI001C2C361A|nr:tetratricopeptide repeat protein [Siccirubricoccus sp. G192]MBV1796728.1 tetratricopeptide repeat protein [Siccirubricoccus sp. G192]